MLVVRQLPRPGARSPCGPTGWAIGVAGLLCVLSNPEPASGVTGVCPDGSLFIVQREEAIPCANAKIVAPDEIPPLRPEMLPKPYTWRVYQEGADPNNPYNLIDAARKVRSLSRGAPVDSTSALARPASQPLRRDRPLPRRRLSGLQSPALSLAEEDVRDLFLIVELSQQRVAAEFVKETVDGGEAFAVAFAHSPAFAERLRREHPQVRSIESAPVLLFSVVAKRGESFFGNFTFTQDHIAFSPDSSSPDQLGVLQGHLGELEAGELTLGYVVLPDRMDLHRPMGVYWNDRYREVTFIP